MSTRDMFGRYPLRIDANQAKMLLSLINNNTDFHKLTVGDVLDMNMLTHQLEEIIKSEPKKVKVVYVS